VAVGARQQVADDGLGPQDVSENLELEREIEQVVFEAEGAEAVCAVLRVGVDAALGGVAVPGGGQAFADLVWREADHGGFVEVVDDLGVQAVAVNGKRLEVALLFNEGADEVTDMILSGFEGQEDGRTFGMGKSGGFGGQRPEQVDHAARQSAHGGGGDFAAGVGLGGDGFEVGVLQSALGGDEQDGIGGDAAFDQGQHARDGGGGLAAACRAGQDDFCVRRPCSQGCLRFGEHGLRVQEEGVFVNEFWIL
jgi:hypothetical protein